MYVCGCDTRDLHKACIKKEAIYIHKRETSKDTQAQADRGGQKHTHTYIQTHRGAKDLNNFQTQTREGKGQQQPANTPNTHTKQGEMHEGARRNARGSACMKGKTAIHYDTPGSQGISHSVLKGLNGG